MKNQYLLFDINELQNKIIKIKFFTKFDLREIYNFIRIKKNFFVHNKIITNIR